MAVMISSASLTAFSSAAGFSDLRPLTAGRPLGTQMRPGGLSAIPAEPGASVQGDVGQPARLLPRGSLLDLSV